MKTPAPYEPHVELVTETLRVGVPIATKEDVAKVARHRGISMSEYTREVVEQRVRRDLRAIGHGRLGLRLR